jgi:CheY-like chemotaxis protein
VFIGASGPSGRLADMTRPINMMGLLKLLDARVSQSTVPAPAPVAGKTAVKPSPKVVQLTVPGALQDVPAAAAAPAPDQILVVDDSDVALRFMANCLGRFGFEVHLAQSGEQALQRVAERHYEFVFMDVTMPGIDGYQTCRLIKKRPYPGGRSAPTVVMLTSRGGMVDKMRGTLSGCDAYLTKPLQQDALMKVIGERVNVTIPGASAQRGAANTV